MSGFICGGIISESQHKKNVEEYGVWADTMSYVMDDENYELYIAAEKSGNKKEANRLFKAHAISQI